MRFLGLFSTVIFIALAPLAHGQTLEVLHSFDVSESGPHPLIQGADGYLYGTTFLGGSNGAGTIFKMSLGGGPNTLVTFNLTNGSAPSAALLQGSDLDFYGTTEIGTNGFGSVFRLKTNGVLTPLFSFHENEGVFPVGKLVQWTDGSLFGATKEGGSNNFGTIFKITTNGAFTPLVAFDVTNGCNPSGGLLLASDGNFYGCTRGGEPNNRGTIFKMTPGGILSTLFAFHASGFDTPISELVEGTNGNLYGITEFGGNYGAGSLFKISLNGVLTTLFSFQPESETSGNNGSVPRAGLALGNDGNFYGTTAFGGVWPVGTGTVFKMTSDGQLTTLVSFTEAEGRQPEDMLLQATDGNLYGTTKFGGTFGGGTIFRIVMSVNLDSRVSGNELVLSWPTNAVGFTLQSAADLNSSTNWIDSTNAPAVVGAQFTVTNSISTNAQFYRLRKP